MKHFFTLLFLVSLINLSAQELQEYSELINLDDEFEIVKNCKEEFREKSLIELWTKNQFNHRFGFIGKNYQRLHVIFISIIRNSEKPDQLYVYGKSKVDDNIYPFQGTIEIKEAYYLKSLEYFGENSGIIAGEYKFYEVESAGHTGIFEGKFVSYWEKDDSGKIHYKDFPFEGNNQFAGTWLKYSGTKPLIANWGTFRIPNSGDLDVGTSEFGVDPKFKEYGWESFLNYRFYGVDKETKNKAEEEELKTWWKE